MFDKYISFLRVIPLFQNLTDSEFNQLLPYFHVQNYKKGSIIFNDNEESDFFHIIYEGKVSIFKEDNNIKETLATKGPGEYFGEMAFLDNFKRSAHVEAIDDLILISIDKSGFLKLLSFSQTSLFLLKNLSKDLKLQNENHMKKVFETNNIISQSEKDLLLQEKQNILHNVIIKLVKEIKNPLTCIKGFSELLKNKSLSDTDKTIYSENIIKQSDYIDQTINDILFYSKQKFQYDKHKFNSFELFNTYKKKILELYNVDFINIENSIDKSINIICDKRYILKAIIHLIDNAYKTVKENEQPVIKVKFYNKTNQLNIEIYDNGSGIPKDIKNDIFKIEKNNIGFGLALTKKIITDHQGQIVYDTSINNYTKFYISIPTNK